MQESFTFLVSSCSIQTLVLEEKHRFRRHTLQSRTYNGYIVAPKGFPAYFIPIDSSERSSYLSAADGFFLASYKEENLIFQTVNSFCCGELRVGEYSVQNRAITEKAMHTGRVARVPIFSILATDEKAFEIAILGKIFRRKDGRRRRMKLKTCAYAALFFRNS